MRESRENLQPAAAILPFSGDCAQRLFRYRLRGRGCSGVSSPESFSIVSLRGKQTASVREGASAIGPRRGRSGVSRFSMAVSCVAVVHRPLPSTMIGHQQSAGTLAREPARLRRWDRLRPIALSRSDQRRSCSKSLPSPSRKECHAAAARAPYPQIMRLSRSKEVEGAHGVQTARRRRTSGQTDLSQVSVAARLVKSRVPSENPTGHRSGKIVLTSQPLSAPQVDAGLCWSGNLVDLKIANLE